MDMKELLRRRIFRLLLIAAWLALGTVMIVLQGDWWYWFAAISYVIALIYIVAEVMTWRNAMRQKGTTTGPKDQEPPASAGQNSNSG
jgi:ABC-type transport system involved in Fe-S cluster assembly fused permease/ATPase subunit